MSEKEYIDFKKEFEEFKRVLENSEPIFDDEDELIFDDDFDLINELNHDSLSESYSNHFHQDDFPEITLETNDLKLNLTIKKDYSKIDDLDKRKGEFFNDLKEFIEEFSSTEESVELMKYYDG